MYYFKLTISLLLFFVTFDVNASTHYDIKDELITLHQSNINDETEITLVSASNKFKSGIIAKGLLKSSINSTGWNIFELWANDKYDDETQAYYAGYAEGCLTSQFIYQHWYNIRTKFCEGKEDACEKINDFIKQNKIWIDKMITNNKNESSYWWQINLYYKQLDGIYHGYNSCKKNTAEISYNDIMLMNMEGDLIDLLEKFKSEGTPTWKLFDEGRCTAIVKILPKNTDIYVSHNSWIRYNYMIRMQKRYILRYRLLPNSEHKIPGEIITFSSYPGIINSIDDFYTISSNIAVQETTIGNSNQVLWQYVTPEDQVLEFVRVMVANRLATSGKSWTEIFSKRNSGTYNNQWMIIDFNKFTPRKPPKKGLLWILEQVPSCVKAADQTKLLKKNRYWPSYNIPFYKNIFILNGNDELEKKHGKWFSYNGCPRAKLMKRDHEKIKDLDSLMTFMRSNNYKDDKLSRCNCTPPYSASNAISARHDLNLPNGTYPIPLLRHRLGGAIDVKMTSSELIKTLQFIAVSGPTTGTGLPVFKWSTSGFEGKLLHLGQPNEWNFKPVLTNWTLF
ncbi:putative phospholipase B-like 2 [Lycorma delicatula]|uniref:putative phospholipase B-like 2 n=1 Tax=Lycorma delicatula TaxID=130591 RepID=UPI003F51932D